MESRNNPHKKQGNFDGMGCHLGIMELEGIYYFSTPQSPRKFTSRENSYMAEKTVQDYSMSVYFHSSCPRIAVIRKRSTIKSFLVPC